MDPNLVVDEEMEPDPELNKITNAILGAAFAVHSKLGPGYQETFYENAMAIEMRHRGINFVRQARFPVTYRDELIGEGKVDFIVEGLVVLELKAVESLTSLFTSQVISYLKATGMKLALLLNFNVRKLTDGIRQIAH
jgi:GxxExxY protein